MITFNKREASAALDKLGFEKRKSKHLQYKLVVGGRLVLTTAVSMGKGPFKPVDKFKQQLLLNNQQLRDTLACPFGREEYLDHLREAGRIPDEDP